MKKNSSNSERISENHIPGINRVVQLDIVIDGIIINGFKHFRLQQSARTHHQFELILAHDSLHEIQNHNLEEARQFLGKRLTVTFKYKNPENESPKRTFVGVVMKVAFSQEKMSLGNIVLKGNSPTILMDSASHTQSFGGSQPVNTSIIADRIIKESLGTYDFDFRIDTQNRGYINYSSQYCETHYNYLARIAEAYGEQFYYDGEMLHFGKLPPHEKSIKLIDGSNVSDVQIELNAVHIKPEYFGYNSSNHAKMIGVDHKIKHLGELSSETYELNNNIFKTRSLVPAPINANMFLDIDDSQKSARGSKAVDVFTVSGKTSVPFLYTGCVVDLAMRKPDSNQTSHFTTLMMTEIHHEVDARGYYKGSFEAIAEGTGFMPKPDFIIPKAEPQVATVISNVDPLNQGRIQVRFDWQLNDTTYFIRMMSPDAGGTDAVSQNRGFVAIPEIGDQVMVGFEYHNPDFPFAMGGMFHGKVGLGGGVDNHLKSIQTRSGIKVLMNDANGSLTIQDPSGNIYFMDGDGNINVTAPNKITMNATDVEINANNNFDINVTNNMTSTVGNTALLTILQKMMVNSPILLQNITDFFHTQAGKALINSENEIKIESPKSYLTGQKKLFLHSDEKAIINSEGTTELKGKEGNIADNTPTQQKVKDIILDAKALVIFRPHNTWESDFSVGMDWLRTGKGNGFGETIFDGDVDYSTIAGYYKDNNISNTFINDNKDANKNGINDLYEAVRNEYSKGVVSNKLDAKGKPSEYFIPKLNIYKNENEPTPSVVNLEIQFEIYEEPDELILEYEEVFFDIVDYFPSGAVAGAVIVGKSSKPPIYTPPTGYKKFKLAPKTVTTTTSNYDISIECKKAFGLLKQVKAYTIKTDPDPAKPPIKKLAGVLQIMPNNNVYRKIQKVVMINVITDITASGASSEGCDAMLEIKEKNTVRKFLRQALVDIVFETVKLDLTGTTQRITSKERDHFNKTYIDGGKLKAYYESPKNTPKGWKDLEDYLNEKLIAVYKSKYSNHIRLFYLPQSGLVSVTETGGTNDWGGYTSGSDVKNIVLPKQGSNYATSHEICHSLGLPHTWKSKNHIKGGTNDPKALKNGVHSFKYQSTWNLMDYSNKQYFLWAWQWKSVNGAAQAEPKNHTPQTL
ncbi:type VI secretion system Vgr family protein [Chryseobacterium sp. JK1]|uniref:type VI secretion system Vgr family protein n=1 Tax=Chryseobacterium sp. JK1 TaxID=874294 RepID=UPI003D686342